tara:strand:+ start:624 stop:1088 length:465 start_codon:yes stop_codon:yes gene_type:complete
MISINSDREFILVNESFSIIKKINLKEIGFTGITGSNLYIYQSGEYKILNYSIKPKLIFSINIQDEIIKIKLENISIENLPNIFKTLKLTLEANIFPENHLCKINREISLRYESKNKLARFISENLMNKFLENLIDKISIRFDRKLIKKVLKTI